jgi:hypothetical protein
MPGSPDELNSEIVRASCARGEAPTWFYRRPQYRLVMLPDDGADAASWYKADPRGLALGK